MWQYESLFLAEKRACEINWDWQVYIFLVEKIVYLSDKLIMEVDEDQQFEDSQNQRSKIKIKEGTPCLPGTNLI